MSNADPVTSARRALRLRPTYGWAIVALVFSSMGTSIGTAQYAFGVFVSPLEQQFGWSRTQINGSLSFFAVGSLAAPFVGRLMDRFGARPVMAISMALFAISYLLRPFMTELWHWYALSAVQFMGLPGAAMLPAGKLISTWFPRNRGRMLGIAMMGANFGGLTIPALAGLLVANLDWQRGYTTFGLMCALVAVSALLFVREKPAAAPSSDRSVPELARSDVSQGVTASEAARTRTFYAVLLAVFAASFTYQAILSQIIPHLQNEGLTLEKAALFLSVTALFGMAGKVTFGLLTERISARFVLIGGLAAQIIGILILITVPTKDVVWLAAPIYGMAMGGTGVLFAVLVQEAFGLRHFGTLFGLANAATAGSAFLGPLMAGVAFDLTRSYAPAFLTTSGIFILGMIASAFAKSVAQARDAPAADAPARGG